METLLGLGVGLLVLLGIIWWLPVLLILRSRQTTGVEKLLWVILILFFSWFSWILYLLIAPVAKPEGQL